MLRQRIRDRGKLASHQGLDEVHGDGEVGKIQETPALDVCQRPDKTTLENRGNGDAEGAAYQT